MRRLLVDINDLIGWEQGQWDEGPELSMSAYAQLASSKDPLTQPLKVRAVVDPLGMNVVRYTPTNQHDKDRMAFAYISGYGVVPVEVVESDPGVIVPEQLEEGTC